MEEIKSVAELMPDWEKEMENRQKFAKRCRIEDGFVVISCDERYPEGSTYDIELSRIDTEKDLIGWVMQLLPKTWVTKKLIELFIYRVCDHFGWNPHEHG